jgi:hypothetical protein
MFLAGCRSFLASCYAFLDVPASGKPAACGFAGKHHRQKPREGDERLPFHPNPIFCPPLFHPLDNLLADQYDMASTCLRGVDANTGRSSGWKCPPIANSKR